MSKNDIDRLTSTSDKTVIITKNTCLFLSVVKYHYSVGPSVKKRSGREIERDKNPTAIRKLESR